MPPEILEKTGAKIKFIKRSPHYFLPTLDGKYLTFGCGDEILKNQFTKFFTEQDYFANKKLGEEISMIREDLADSWLKSPLSLEDTSEKYIRKELQKVFINLVTQPVENYLERFDFKSELIIGMYSITDGFSGLTNSFGGKGTGMNFLVHNMCRLPSSDGTFMVVEGGMGSITQEFYRIAKEEGVEFRTNAVVKSIEMKNGSVNGVVLENEILSSDVILCNCDPFRTRNLIGESVLDQTFNNKLNLLKRNGTTMKVNFVLDKLPTFNFKPDNIDPFSSTIHILPSTENGGKGIIETVKHSFEEVKAGRLSDFPTIEWYTNTISDPSLVDDHGHHNAAFFVQWVPYELSESSWVQEKEQYTKHLVNIVDRFAPDFSSSIVESFTMTPRDIERKFGMSYGHIHHIDNSFGFDQRVPYKWSVPGLYSCSAGCHPAGSVLGAAGHNSANEILDDLK